MKVFKTLVNSLKKIYWKYFFLSAFIGFAFIVIMGPQFKKVYMYPQKNILNKPIFKDRTNTCYFIKKKFSRLSTS